MAVKYGTTLSHNYISADGTIIYDVSIYGKYVAGIGRDDASGLVQKQSGSIDGDVVTIFNGTYTAATLPVSNAANSNGAAADKYEYGETTVVRLHMLLLSTYSLWIHALFHPTT
ncbi:MAG: hypothetical protein R2822_12590 [Spirosomataceae bacterium]